jgi:predicted DNA-binding ribbon-helix-helix protein
MTSPVVKRSIVIDGHKTSVSMEEVFWRGLKECAKEQSTTLSKLVGSIAAKRVAGANLSSAIRVYLLDRIQTQLRDLETGRPQFGVHVSEGQIL